MNATEKVISFIKQKFVLNAGDSNYIRKSKFLNILLLILGFISCIVLLIPPIFTIFGIPFGFEERINKIYSGSLILLGSIIIILLIKKFASRLFANILFINLMIFLVFANSDPVLLSSGVLIFWYLLPVLITSLLFRSIWSILITTVILIIIFLNYLMFGLFPSSIDLVGFIIISSIGLFSSRILEKSLMYSQSTEKNTREAYNRVELYKDLFSHDVSNIFQNVQSFIDLCMLYLDDPHKFENFKDLINLANQQIYRGENLVSNVRNLSELEKSKQPLISEDALLILNQAITNIKTNFQDIAINIKIDSQEKSIYTKSNNKLIFLFKNILRNSIVHNENPTVKILIKISKEFIDTTRYIKFKFIDNGIGIPDSIKDKIFLRGLEKDDEIGGIGLGLTLVNKIIENLDGKIKVEDKIAGDYSQGSIFTILIPTIG
ncbi:hypothetical protein LCGC14_0935030 [marine sediment metagenome]|uniref:Histidine kinase domain-containing protein n=1 Tax=marine sediment metagenome TaxID=412755 RepID=A0A0F9P7Y1_9ZZZZ